MRSRLGQGISLVLMISFIALFVWAAVIFASEDRSMAMRRLETESARLASGLFFEKMTAIAQLSVALLGATWVFLTLTEGKVTLNSKATVICFWVANLSFALSLATYAIGYDFIVTRIFHHSTFDIDAPFVSKVSHIQQLTFLLGCLSLGATILLGRKT